MSEHTTTALKDARSLSLRLALILREYRSWISTVTLAAVDAFAFFLAMILFRSERSVPGLVLLPRALEHQTPLDIFIILGSIFILVRYISGDYSRRLLFWDEARTTTVALIVASTPDMLIFAVFKEQYSAFAEIGSWVFLLAAVPMLRYAGRHGLAAIGIWKIPTALVATGARANAVYAALNKAVSLGYDIRWLVLDRDDRELPNKPSHLKQLFLSDADDIAEKMMANGCGQVVIATEDTQSTGFATLVHRLMEREISVAFIPTFVSLPVVRVSTSYFFGHDILLYQVRNSLWRAPHRIAKRSFDIVGSLALLLLFSPVLIIASLAIRAHDGGKVTYSQRRVGRHGRQFDCMKFRTMAEDADERRARWEIENPELYAEFLKTYKLRDDPRVHQTGKMAAQDKPRRAAATA